jgi:hypothetical protein
MSVLRNSRSTSARAFAPFVLTVVAIVSTACTSSGGGANATPPSHESASPSATPTGPPASSLAPIQGTYAPTIDPSNFVRTIDNRYWPLIPGTKYRYEGVRGTTPQTDVEIVTHATKMILGIPCTVVKDTVSEHGTAIERTFDWYAQDKDGNVWYMGELSLELQHGHMVKASDSWESGVDGGKPGIIMPGAPQPGEAYRQEYYPPGQALDEARVLSLSGNLSVPYGSYQGLLVTSERSPLEPQTEQKYYAPGLGEIAEKVVKGHHEQFQLVAVTH